VLHLAERFGYASLSAHMLSDGLLTNKISMFATLEAALRWGKGYCFLIMGCLRSPGVPPCIHGTARCEADSPKLLHRTAIGPAAC
jgi:hypothetical protein